MELVNVATNKNTVPGDKSALIPGGLRLGSPAMTTRGFKEQEFKKVVDLIHKAIEIALHIQTQVPGPKFAEFKKVLGNGEGVQEIQELKKEIVDWTKEFPVIGFRFDTMKYK